MEGAGQEHQIGVPLSRWQFAEYLVLLSCAVKGQGESIGKGILVIVLDMAGFHMGFLDALCHGLLIFCQNSLEQPFTRDVRLLDYGEMAGTEQE